MIEDKLPSISASPRAASAIPTRQAIDYTLPHWFVILLIILSVWVGLPFLAPVMMHLGWTLPAMAIYTFYSFQCHQLPERSFFLFGQHFMYPLSQIQAVWKNTNDPAVLRQFIGNAQMGWKVAWSDRMVSMYTTLVIFAPVWWFLRRRWKILPWWGLFLFLLPMAIDGGTHLISDLSGIGMGFRSSNVWLAALTHHAFPPTFYAGAAWGSFNSIMRLLTGVLFGVGVDWYALPRLNQLMDESNGTSPFPNR
ncbi:MAG: DUF2085 domain-containing protein [Chloroflexi bacterium]|nr:DUF2085 domain-containing protein [Chloroflexota bacterium]